MQISKSRVVDFVLYFLISMVAVASIFVPSVLSVSLTEYKRWLALIFAAVMICGFAIEESKSLWGKKSFWVLASIMVVINCIMFAVLILEKMQLSGFMLTSVCFVEICLFYGLKRWLVRM